MLARNTLIAINTIIFVLVLLSSLAVGIELSNTDLVLVFGAFSDMLVNSGYLWLLITANFVHVFPIHFAMNMLSLTSLSATLTELYSNKKVFIVYIIGGLFASLATLVFANITNNSLISVGASGSIYAMFGMIFGCVYKANREGEYIGISLGSFTNIIILNILINFLPSVNFMAHIGGFVTGFVLAFVLKREDYTKTDVLATKVLFIASVSLLVLSFALLLLNLFINLR